MAEHNHGAYHIRLHLPIMNVGSAIPRDSPPSQLMQRFATLALAALLAPAALAQSGSLVAGPEFDRPAVTLDYSSASLVAITPNSSTEVESSTIACRANDGAGGTTENSFYRVIDLADYTIPDMAQLTSVDFGLALDLRQAATADGTINVYTLPAGTNVSSGFSRSALTELASRTITFDADTLGLYRAILDDPDDPFDAAPELEGNELLVVEMFFGTGVTLPDAEQPEFDASAGSNEAAADGVTYLATVTSCGGIEPTPIGDLVPGQNPQWVVILNVDPVINNTAVGDDPEGRLSLGAVAPNPIVGDAVVTVTLAEAGQATLSVYDVLGREVASVLRAPLGAGSTDVRIDAGALPVGTYLARLTANGGTVVRPFTVAR